jgi:hypothetical protein
MTINAKAITKNNGPAFLTPAIMAAAKSHGKNLASMSNKEATDWMHKWAARHRNIAEHIVIPMNITGISRELGSILSDQVDGFVETERSQRYCRVDENGAFLYDHPYNKIAIKAYQELLNAGATKEDARYVLPVNATTEMVVTANRETWIKICRSLSQSLLYGSKLLMSCITQELIRIDGDYDFERIDQEDIPYEHKILFLGEHKAPHDNYISELTDIDDCPVGIYDVIASMSWAALYQLKRHRKILSLKCSSPIQGCYYTPSKITSDNLLSKIYEEALDEHSKMDDVLALNASIINISFLCEKACWKNIVHFRDSPHAQEEIRGIVHELNKEAS